MKIKKYIYLTIALVLLILFIKLLFFREKTAHDLPAILKSGRLAVVTDSSVLGFAMKGDSVFGFQYEIAKAFADSLNLELIISTNNNFKECLEGLRKGNYDIYADFIPITSEWQNEYLFTIPLKTSRQVLIQCKDSSEKIIKNQVDLAGDTIYIPKNSPHKLRLKNLSDEIADTIYLVEVNDVNSEDLVKWVAMGKIKQTICDERDALKWKLQYPNLDISLPVGFDQQYGWMLYKESKQLQKKLNDFLNDFIGSEAYWKIYRKYY